MWVVDRVEPRPTASPLPRFDCTDDPKTESSVTGSIDPREAAVIVTEPTRRKHASYVTRHG